MREQGVYQQLRSHLAYLRLSAAAEQLPSALEQAERAKLSHTRFLERLLAALEGRWQTTMRFWNGPALLIIDELGYLPLPAEAASHLFQVVSRRYEHGSIILTTNRGIASWGEIFDDATVAPAILDRLLHHGIVLAINGPSYRMRRHQARVETLRAGLQAPKPGD